jgi:hypothetical protein
MMAQTLDEHKQDTVWLKSGEVIPCKVSSENLTTNMLTISYQNPDGVLVTEQIDTNKIARYTIGPQEQYPQLWLSRIDMKDGTQLTGYIVSETEEQIELQMQDIGILTIKRKYIKKIVQLDKKGRTAKSFWFKNPHATRLLFAPTAIPLRQGEGYYQNIYIVGNMFNVGVLNNLSIGGGFDFITMFSTFDDTWRPMLNFNFKSGFRMSENFHMGIGGLYATVPGEGYAGILYGLGTVGSYNSNFTAGLGWGFVDGTFEQKPFIMFGGMARISEKLWFVSENWVAPLDHDNAYYFVFSYGLRFAANRIAVDLAFINSKDIIQNLIIGVPYVDFVVKLGKQ